MKYNNKH